MEWMEYFKLVSVVWLVSFVAFTVVIVGLHMWKNRRKK